MPRIPNWLVRKAHSIDPLLPALLSPCRSLQVAQSELQWLREHVERVAEGRRSRGDILAKGSLLSQLVSERASGKPLQYILGTEYFGDLEIRCRRGVLIPRQDTAASVTHLAGLLRNAQKLPPELRLLDLCTGTGCIPLLFRHELYAARGDVDVRILGVDVSDKALHLARHNMQRISANRPHRKDAKTQLMKADVLINPFADQVEGLQPLKSALNFYGLPSFWDILISNPPYISPVAYWKSTTPSVRRFEPALALVPPGKVSMGDTAWGDLFYPRLLEIARDVEARIVLLEVADMEQALRVAQRAHDLKIFDGVEIWRDSPGQSPETPLEGAKVVILGAGHGRSVLCWRGIGASWLGKTMVTDAEKDAQRLLQSSTGRALESDTSQNNAPSMEPQFA